MGSALENTGKRAAHCDAHLKAHQDVARTVRMKRAADGFRRGIHRQPGEDEPFVYVPCLNKSRAHLKVLAHVLAPYVGDDA